MLGSVREGEENGKVAVMSLNKPMAYSPFAYCVLLHTVCHPGLLISERKLFNWERFREGDYTCQVNGSARGTAL